MLKLGYILTEFGLLTDDQLKTALELQKMTGKKLGEVIIDKGMLTDIEIMRALERQCKIPYIDLTDVHADPTALSLIGEDYARKFCAIPIGFEDDKLIVVINDPLDIILVDEIGYLTGRTILPRLSTRKQILIAIETNYNRAAGQLAAHKADHDLDKKTRKSKAAAEPKTEPIVIETPAVHEPVVIETPEVHEPVVIETPEVHEPVPVDTATPSPTAPQEDPVVPEPVTEDRLTAQGGFMLDFTKSVKQYFPVNMTDNQTIRVRMPTKRVFAALIELQDKLSRLVTLNTNIAAQLDEIYDLCARILSNNLDQKEISSDYLSDMLDLEDLRIFYKSYADFVNSVLNGANDSVT